MLFNSLQFAFFLPVVFLSYWFIAKRNSKFQNILLLFASYFFYASWDYRFLFLLFFSTLLDFYTGKKVAKSETKNRRKFWLWTSIGINLGFLGVFKYYDFFISSFAESISYLGLAVNPWTLQLVLPVGISFYTFHGLSYVIDLYYDRILPERNFVDYSLFVSFFPLLVAGPIERATHLLPQIKERCRVFNYDQAVSGVRLILWGLFKKVVVADNAADIVNAVFANSLDASGLELVIGAVFFALQIYGDFSGYSDIAIGTAKLFGIELMVNFRVPYFSRDIAEFWRRWHISLTTWFRDYVYIPLGGSRNGKLTAVRNTFIVFILSGLWHGANWTFVVWGLLNAIFFVPLLLSERNRLHLDTVAHNRILPSLIELFELGFTFTLVCITWIFFRAESVTHAMVYISNMFNSPFWGVKVVDMKQWLLPVILMWISLEWAGRKGGVEQYIASIESRLTRKVIYYGLLVLIGLFGAFEETQFIYFQF